jgi:hypothetical protein
VRLQQAPPRAIILLVIWAPFVLALALGLVIAGGLYAAYMWPQVDTEPEPEPKE